MGLDVSRGGEVRLEDRGEKPDIVTTLRHIAERVSLAAARAAKSCSDGQQKIGNVPRTPEQVAAGITAREAPPATVAMQPLGMVTEWIHETYTRAGYGGYAEVGLARKDGLVVPDGYDYDDLSKKERSMHPEVLLLVGWMNHDKTLFSPSKRGMDDDDKDIDKVRMKKAAEWDASFRGWCGATVERRMAIEHAYNRQFRGYVAPTYTAEPLPIARWKKDGPRLHPHQVAGARRVLANRGGLLAFDVGVGKTYTGIATLARARQKGWCKRPVVLVPNSIVWKWEADIRRVLPDYRIAVIGSKRKVISRGERKGFATSDTDTPQERAEKWTRFQAGEYDVVLLTYTALGRTRMNEKAVRAYAEQTEAIQREVKLRQRNAQKRKKLTEREEAGGRVTPRRRTWTTCSASTPHEGPCRCSAPCYGTAGSGVGPSIAPSCRTRRGRRRGCPPETSSQVQPE